MDWRTTLSEYLAARFPGADSVTITRVGNMPAGASNSTAAIDVEVVAGGMTHTLPLVLRPERPDGILAPYDVGRQFRVMRALAGTEVPVPAVLCYEAGAAILGAPFYLMYRLRCETLPLFWYDGRSPRLPAAAAALAAVHAVDWRAQGLGFLLPEGGQGVSPIACELAQWRVRAARMGTDRMPLTQALERYLLGNEPAGARFSLVHGDPNPGNYLFRGDTVVAVVDWELAAIGDPRGDLGFYAALVAIFGGYADEPGRTVLSDAYEAVTGQPLADMAYYEAFGLYRMLIVMAGWGGGGWGYYGSDAVKARLDVLLGPGWAGALA